MEANTRGGTPLYGLYRYVRPQRVWFFSRCLIINWVSIQPFAAILVINRVSIFNLRKGQRTKQRNRILVDLISKIWDSKN